MGGLPGGRPSSRWTSCWLACGTSWSRSWLALVRFADALGGEQGDQAFLPVVVAAFDFAFGLGRGGVEQLDAIKVEGLAELGEGLGIVRVKERVIVHVERQRQAVGLKDAGEKIEVGEQGFGGREARAGVQPRGVIENVQEDLWVGTPGSQA